MLGFKGKYSFSFTWKRLLGISGFKSKLKNTKTNVY